jgi:hypothetical protein
MLPPLLLSAALVALPPGVDARLFPDVDKIPVEEVELAGLSTLYPGRILHEAPHTINDLDKGREARAYTDGLPRNLTYLRVYDLNTALPQISKSLADKPALILDLRYVWADAPTAEAFANELSAVGLAFNPLHRAGEGLPQRRQTRPRGAGAG